MSKKNLIWLFVSFTTVIFSCKNDKEEMPENPYIPTPFTINVPSNLPVMEIPDDNRTTVEGVKLGRMLYYDSLMSPQGMRACASCHHQSAGFTTPTMNVIPHVNLAYGKKFLWDGHLQGTLEHAMKFEVEEFFNTDISKLQADSKYPQLFYEAFGSRTITYQNVEYALAQFLRTIVSGNSKFDRFLRHEENLTTQEMMGFTIFNTEQGDCFHCHSLPLMSDNEMHNIGLDSIFTGSNTGYYNFTGNQADLGKFKSPSLRNVSLRSSFMHDGRFSTLDEVINHYNNGVKQSPSLDPIMTKPGKEFGLALTPFDIAALKAFLMTLTDTIVTTNPEFSSPF